MTTFSLWLKNELSAHVGRVSISKRLKDQPAILFGQISSSMRMVMQMMEQSNPGQMEQMNKNQTLEINPNHPLIVKLNELRKRNPSKAAAISRQLMDNILMSSGIPFNLQESTKRSQEMINEYLNTVTSGNQLGQ